MSDANLTPEAARASIVPRSDQINSDDLLTGPITVTIEKVRRGDKDQPIQIDLVGMDRVYRPCKSMRRILIAAFSDDPKLWVGQRMTLYSDPDVMWAGVKVGGIRISHLSGIGQPRMFLITQTRGRRSEVTIHPIADVPSNSDAKEIEKAKIAIAEAATLDALKKVGGIIKANSKTVQDAVRGLYAQRQKELAKAPEPKSEPEPEQYQHAMLDEWTAEVAKLSSAEQIADFRQNILPACPAEILDQAEELLQKREKELTA